MTNMQDENILFQNNAFYLLDHWLIAVVMLAVLIGACEAGYRLGLARQGAPDSLRSLMTAIGGAVLGLLGLLLGFALAMAISRWDDRHDIIIQEANAIRTLSLRASLVEEPFSAQLSESLQGYTKARIVVGRSRDRVDTLEAALRESEEIHAAIWSVVKSANRPPTPNANHASLINSANQVIDMHELRIASLQNHLPSTLFYLLFSLAALSVGFLAWGFGAAAHRGRTPIFLLTILIGAILLLIMDVNRPQRGMIEVGVASLERVQNGRSR